jgi:hypothetical protein
MFAVKREEPIRSLNILSRTAPHSAIGQTSQEHYIKTLRHSDLSSFLQEEKVLPCFPSDWATPAGALPLPVRHRLTRPLRGDYRSTTWRMTGVEDSTSPCALSDTNSPAPAGPTGLITDRHLWLAEVHSQRVAPPNTTEGGLAVESTKKRQDCKKSKSVVISQGTSDLSLPFRRIRGDC